METPHMESPPEIIGTSSNITKIKDLIQHVAGSEFNVIISGETGVGKELIAQNLYFYSPRRGEPFIKVNCAALPEGLLESELFGYEQGAFTGAQRRKKGKFELAHKGVLFLDEIGDMSLPLQSKLLHVLQGGEYSPLGSEKQLQTNAWVISATNHDLKEDLKNQKFREDLYYRLNIINIHIDPLRKRSEDIPLLIDYYIQRYTLQFGNKYPLKPDTETLERLTSYSWPGNVRELQNVLKKLFILGNWEDILTEISLPEPVPANLPPDALSMNQFLADFSLPTTGNVESMDFEAFSLKAFRKDILDQIEKKVIAHILKELNWNRTKAARFLKISYKTLLYKIEELNIKPPSS